jgi:uncharacterized Fe-S cluster-containing radical SAM superfamily protein
VIDTDATSEQLRAAAIDAEARTILISRLEGSDQEHDLSLPTNCDGYGRIHHFNETGGEGWPPNPLPWLPAQEYLGLERVPDHGASAQVFQNAVCNWRCWYCFVPFNLLRADPDRSAWRSAEWMVDAYLALEERPPILDLSGGQPDLVPEWALWTLEALADRGADATTFLWSDDNLSNDYLFRYLNDDQLSRLADHPGYGRVGCLKGFDHDSFAFNTSAEPALFDRQIELVGRLWDLMPKLWLYITVTTSTVPADLESKLYDMLARLADIDPALPRRVVPLRIYPFRPTRRRMREAETAAIDNQDVVMAHWHQALAQF